MSSLSVLPRFGSVLLAIAAGASAAVATPRTLYTSVGTVDGVRLRVQQQVRSVWITLADGQSVGGRATLRFESDDWRDMQLVASAEERNLELRRGFKAYALTRRVSPASSSTRTRSFSVAPDPTLRAYGAFHDRFGSAARLTVELRGASTVRVAGSKIELSTSDLQPQNLAYALAIVDLARKGSLTTGLRVVAPSRIGAGTTQHPVEEGLIIWHANFPKGRVVTGAGGRSAANVAALLRELAAPGSSSLRGRVAAEVRSRTPRAWKVAIRSLRPGSSDATYLRAFERSRIDPDSDFYTGRPGPSDGGADDDDKPERIVPVGYRENTKRYTRPRFVDPPIIR